MLSPMEIYPTFLCLFVLHAFVANTGVSSTDEVIGPVLGIDEEFIDVSLNSTLSLNCSGHFPLAWQYQNPVNRTISTLDSSEELVLSVSGRTVFQSVIELHFLDHRQTGRYSCIYNSTSHSGSASLYVFVNDLLNLLLHVEKTEITVWGARPFIVPCLATKSDADVKLWNFSEDEIVPPDLVRYDPTEGFLVADPTNYFEGFFDCKAEFDGYRTGIIEFQFDFFVVPEQPQVRINGSGTVYVEVNSSFSLFCIIEATSGVLFENTWAHPVVDDSRVHRGNHIADRTTDLGSSTRYVASLTVWNVTKTDEGYYHCNVTDHAHQSSSAKVLVRVGEKPHFIKTNMNSSSIVADPQSEFKFFCYVGGFPKPNLTWYRDGTALEGDMQIVEFADNFQTLIIPHPVATDSGHYECRAENQVGNASLNATLIVKKVQSVTPSDDSNQIVTFSAVEIDVCYQY